MDYQLAKSIVHRAFPLSCYLLYAASSKCRWPELHNNYRSKRLYESVSCTLSLPGAGDNILFRTHWDLGGSTHLLHYVSLNTLSIQCSYICSLLLLLCRINSLSNPCMIRLLSARADYSYKTNDNADFLLVV